MAPAFFSASASVSSPPLKAHRHRPDGVHMDAAGLGGLPPRIYWICSGVSTVGLVFAMQATAVTPPRAAARRFR